jgi:hypothetical protein
VDLVFIVPDIGWDILPLGIKICLDLFVGLLVHQTIFGANSDTERLVDLLEVAWDLRKSVRR